MRDIYNQYSGSIIEQVVNNWKKREILNIQLKI